MNERKIQLLKGSVDLMLNQLTSQLNKAQKEEEREQITKVIEEYLEIRKELPEHIGGRPEDRK